MTTNVSNDGGEGRLYYVPSGRFSVSSLITILPIAFIVQVIAAAVYAYLMLYVPFLKLKFLFSICFGAAVGAITLLAIRQAKVRNERIAMLVTVLLALLTFYACWVIWMYGMINRLADEPAPPTFMMRLMEPHFFWVLMRGLNATGFWAMSSHDEPIHGVMLWSLWAIEAATVLGFAIVIPLRMTRSVPFCETCTSWCKLTKSVARLKTSDAGEIIRQCEAKNFTQLAAIGPPAETDMDWLRVDLDNCPGCPDTNMLSVRAVKVSVNKKGERSESTRDIVSQLLVNAAEAQQIRAISAPLLPQA